MTRTGKRKEKKVLGSWAFACESLDKDFVNFGLCCSHSRCLYEASGKCGFSDRPEHLYSYDCSLELGALHSLHVLAAALVAWGRLGVNLKRKVVSVTGGGRMWILAPTLTFFGGRAYCPVSHHYEAQKEGDTTKKDRERRWETKVCFRRRECTF